MSNVRPICYILISYYLSKKLYFSEIFTSGQTQLEYSKSNLRKNSIMLNVVTLFVGLVQGSN